jgi:Fe-S-cluster containining protein
MAKNDVLPERMTGCKRCGTCCKNGGPAIHRDDLALIESGGLLLKHLYTLRRGEPARDNLTHEVLPCSTDIIKIKSRKESTACIFYDELGNSCTIYEKRPIECRVMKCWDTLEIRSIYNQNRLTRYDIMGNINGLWDLVADHQERCPYGPVLAFTDEIMKLKRKNSPLEKEVRYMMQYDMEIRSLAMHKGNMDREMTEFLFGRPIADTLKSLGMKILYQKDKVIIAPLS